MRGYALDAEHKRAEITGEIALQVGAHRGLEGDPGIVSIMTRRVGGVLRDKRDASPVRSLEEPGCGRNGRLCVKGGYDYF